MALFCQARPLTDLVVECREIAGVKDMPIKMLPCRVQKMDLLAPDVMRLRLKLPANERLQFLAGQYMDILLRNGTRRSFSMANPPHDDDFIELHLRNYGGPFSEQVFARMKEKRHPALRGTVRHLLPARGRGEADRVPRERHRVRADQGDDRVRAARRNRAADDALLGLPRALRSLPERSRRALEHGARAALRARAFGSAARRPVDRPHRVRTPRGDGGPAGSFRVQVYACGAPPMVEAAHRDFIAQCGLPEEEFFSDSFTPASRAVVT